MPYIFFLVYHLWHYRSPDERIKIREKSEQDEMWKETSELLAITKRGSQGIGEGAF